MWAIYKKELKSYFLSPVGYITIGVFMLMYSIFFYLTTIVYGSVFMGDLYYATARYGLLIIIPLLTMRMFSEERKNGTEQLLLTSPRSVTSIVLGKFLAAVTVILITLVFSLIYAIIIRFLGKINIPTLIVTMFGFLLVAMAAISIGMLASSITENQIIAAIITIVVLVAPWFLVDISSIFSSVDLIDKFIKFANGLISVADLVSLISITVMCILITIIIIKRRKSVLLILIIITVCIGLNIVVENINLTDFDFTEDKIYSLSSQSKQIAESIDEEVDIMIVNMPEAQQDYANKYNSVNDKIKIEIVNDVTSRPDLADDYGLTADSYVIIVKSADRIKILSSYDLYTIDYTTYEQKDITEEALTNAIIDVTTEEKPIIYNLTGHNKYSSYDFYYFIQDLLDEAYEFNDIDLLTAGKIPDDCSVLMITTLAEDITEAERDAILEYIEKGGKIILFSDPNSTGKEMPNFQDVLDEYGVSISEGVMLEQDSSRMLYGTPSAILVTVSPYTSVTQETNMNMNACFMTTGRINVEDSEKLEKLGVELETLATTSSESFYRTDYTLLQENQDTKTDADEGSPNAIVGALLKKKIDDNTTSELIVYSNNIFITNYRIAISQDYFRYALDFYNNEDLAMNSIAYLTERDNMITIRKDVEVSTYTVTKQQNTIILIIIFTIPVLIIILGIIIWQIRRRKR